MNPMLRSKSQIPFSITSTMKPFFEKLHGQLR
jgi:hypothetical protein